MIRGSAKGRHLRSVKGNITRPITQRVKEALFNIIGADIDGTSFLDLFAGTGSVGIEALSNGADFVLFIELHRNALDTLRFNLKTTGLEKKSQVLHKNALIFLQEKPNYKFDYIYVAPPQYQSLWKETLLLLDSQPSWLNKQGWIIVQIDNKEYENLQLDHLNQFDLRRYGDTILVFYRHKDD